VTTPIYVADDYGLAETIDRAILELARRRALDGASAVVVTSGLQHLAALRELPHLKVGLHLCITEGRPASPPAALGALVTDDGRFGGLGRLARLWLAGRLEAAALRKEIAAQIERLRAGAGRVDYVDGHQHVQLLPPVERALEDVIRSAGLGALRVRLGRVRSGRLRHRLVLNALIGLRRARSRALPFETTEDFVDYESFADGTPCARSTEVMLHVAHPDVPDPSLDATSYPFAARVEQFQRRVRATAGSR